jgi:hypothetical protein
MNLAIFIGALNPIHSGHLATINRIVDRADCPVRVFATNAEKDRSRIVYKDWDEKLEFTRAAVESVGAEMSEKPADKVFDVIRDCCFEIRDGVLTIYCGDDRAESYRKMAASVLTRYQARGELTDVTVDVQALMDRDTDESAFSGTAMRRAVEEGDFKTFNDHSAMPSDELTKRQFDAIKRRLSMRESVRRKLHESEGEREAADRFAHELSDAGASVYYVGGCIRDEVIGREPNDFDMCATNAKCIKTVFEDKIESEHWTPQGLFFVINYEGAQIEIISLSGTIEKRLEESDITINALAKDAVTGKIVDPTGGLADARSRTISYTPFMLSRFPDVKKSRGLALLRGVRFMSQLGWDMSDESKQAVYDYGKRGGSFTKGVNAERVKKEMGKLRAGEHASKALKLLSDSGCLDTLLSELQEIA